MDLMSLSTVEIISATDEEHFYDFADEEASHVLAQRMTMEGVRCTIMNTLGLGPLKRELSVFPWS